MVIELNLNQITESLVWSTSPMSLTNSGSRSMVFLIVAVQVSCKCLLCPSPMMHSWIGSRPGSHLYGLLHLLLLCQNVSFWMVVFVLRQLKSLKSYGLHSYCHYATWSRAFAHVACTEVRRWPTNISHPAPQPVGPRGPSTDLPPRSGVSSFQWVWLY